VNAQFRELCRDLSREFNAQDIDELSDDGYIEVDGVALGIDLHGGDPPNRLTFRVDLGPIDPEHRMQVLEEALAINLSSSDSCHGLIGLDSELDHLLLVRSFDYVPGVELSVMAAAMRQLAQFSRDFQDAIQALIEPEGLADIDTHAVFG
jgi:hypothetical protein